MGNEDFYAGSSAGGPSPEERRVLAASAATSGEHLNGARSAYSPTDKLGFLGSIRVGFQLLPVCWGVLMQEASLLIVPIMVMVGAAIAVFGYADALGGLRHLTGPNRYSTAIRLFPLVAFVSVTSVTGQAVIVAASTDTLEGRHASVGSAWKTAGSQLPRIVFFGVVYAVERTVTSTLRGRRWSLGTLAANTIDRAWDFATFLTIPVLLYEDLPVFAAVKRSGQLVAKRWGVQLTARSALNAAMLIVILPIVVVGLIIAASVSAVLGEGIVLVSFVAMMVLASALTGVLSAALYRFGTTGLVAPGFSEADMWAVFARR